MRSVCPRRSTRETDGIAAKLLRCGIASEALRRYKPLRTDISITEKGSRTKHQPKEEVFRTDILWTSGGHSRGYPSPKLRSGHSKSWKNKHLGADIHDPKERTSTTLRDSQKLRSEKLWAEFSFPTGVKLKGGSRHDSTCHDRRNRQNRQNRHGCLIAVEGKVLSRTVKAVKTAKTVMKATPLELNRPSPWSISTFSYHLQTVFAASSLAGQELCAAWRTARENCARMRTGTGTSKSHRELLWLRGIAIFELDTRIFAFEVLGALFAIVIRTLLVQHLEHILGDPRLIIGDVDKAKLQVVFDDQAQSSQECPGRKAICQSLA